MGDEGSNIRLGACPCSICWPVGKRVDTCTRLDHCKDNGWDPEAESALWDVHIPVMGKKRRGSWHAGMQAGGSGGGGSFGGEDDGSPPGGGQEEEQELSDADEGCESSRGGSSSREEFGAGGSDDGSIPPSENGSDAGSDGDDAASDGADLWESVRKGLLQGAVDPTSCT